MTPDAAYHLRIGIREAGTPPGAEKVKEIAQLACEAGLRVRLTESNCTTRAGYVREVEPAIVWLSERPTTDEFDWLGVEPGRVATIDVAEQAS